MTTTDIIALIVTIIGVVAFATVISILYRHYIKISIAEISKGNRDIELIDKMIYENNPSVKKKQKAVEIVKNVVYYVILAILIPTFGLAIYSRIKNNVTTIGGNSVLVVASGSMSKKDPNNTYLVTNHLNNQFQTYDMIVVAKVKDVSDLKVYDVIAYRNDKGINVIHRIIEKKTSSDGEVSFVTRGDANSSSDSYNPVFKDIIGVYTNRRIRAVGVFVMFFQSYAGIVTIVSVIYTMIYISRFNQKLEEAIIDREIILNNQFDIDLLNENTYLEMEQDFQESIFYRGEVYLFNNKGFVEKREMNESETNLFNELQREQDEILAKNTKKRRSKNGEENK